MVFLKARLKNTLSLNVVLIPATADPFKPLDTGLPAPQDTTTSSRTLIPAFEAGIIPGLEHFRSVTALRRPIVFFVREFFLEKVI